MTECMDVYIYTLRKTLLLSSLLAYLYFCSELKWVL